MRRRIAFFGCLLALAVVLAGCGDDKPDDYDAEVEDNFVRDCVEQNSGENAEAVCQCAYDKFREEIPFDRFSEVDEELQDDPETTLPDDFVNLYTDCVLEQDSAGLTTPTLPPGSTTTTAPAGGPATTATTAPLG